MPAPKQKLQDATGKSARKASHEEISVRAYFIYLDRGATHGDDLSDWFQAETLLRAENPAPGLSRKASA